MTQTATITAVLTYLGQPIQDKELQRALDAYRRRLQYSKQWMRERRKGTNREQA